MDTIEIKCYECDGQKTMHGIECSRCKGTGIMKYERPINWENPFKEDLDFNHAHYRYSPAWGIALMKFDIFEEGANRILALGSR
jgi:hypothetical protein